jgi:hypothetical protein
VAGRGALAGYVNLLRRNIPPREILNILFDEWTKSLLHRRNVRIASVDLAQAIMERERARPPAARQPVQAYREIAQALKSPEFRVPGSESPASGHPTPAPGAQA